MTHHNFARMFTAAACLALFSCSNDADSVEHAADADSPVVGSETPEVDSNNLEGHWSGSWGGGAQGDVVFQPVLAELMIEGDQVELSGFPDATGLNGTIRHDTDVQRIVITAVAEESGEAGILEYTYALSGDDLTLTDQDGRTVRLLKHRQVQDTSSGQDPPVP